MNENKFYGWTVHWTNLYKDGTGLRYIALREAEKIIEKEIEIAKINALNGALSIIKVYSLKEIKNAPNERAAAFRDGMKWGFRLKKRALFNIITKYRDDEFNNKNK